MKNTQLANFVAMGILLGIAISVANKKSSPTAKAPLKEEEWECFMGPSGKLECRQVPVGTL